MAKATGLGDNLYIGGVNVSGDIGSLGRIGGGPSPLEVTAIDKEAFERLGGLRDGGMEYTAFFNPGSGGTHEALAALPTADVVLTYCRGTTLGNPAAGLIGKQVNYDGSRGADGSFTFEVQSLANGYGIDWGRQLTAGPRTDSEATNGDSVDFGAAGSFGLQAFLHVFAFDGTDVTIKLQQSSDDGDTDSFADVTGGAFTTIDGTPDAPYAERIQTARDQAVEQYLRVVTTTSGGFTSVEFAVMVVVNPVAVVF